MLSSPNSQQTDTNVEELSSVDSRGVRMRSVKLTGSCGQQTQTRITFGEQEMVITTDQRGNQVNVTGSIQLDGDSNNVWKVWYKTLLTSV